MKLQVQTVQIEHLKPALYSPRRWQSEAIEQLKESIQRFGVVDPLLVNNGEGRENIVIGGHFRLKVAKDLGITELPVVYVTIPELEREKELNLRLNKNLGEWDIDLLKEFDEAILADIGFTSEELDIVFEIDDAPENFDLKKELEKLDIQVEAKQGDIYQLGESRLMVGDSTIPEDFTKLMNGKQADLCLCDPPYRLSYMKGGIRHGEPVTGFGAKRNRRYLETE